MWLKTVQSKNSATFDGKPDLPKWITVAIINIASARNAYNNNNWPHCMYNNT